ncbi:MAG: Rpn family recombination-promoting nuclease/putative transposase [Cytophagales bacterium]|nr:Rpn family recombination-promoting nuclease/putative transposase [Cytophagales bacterium]
MKDKNEQKINQAHDAYGKESLSRKEVAIDSLKGHLPKELLELIDLDSLELTKGSFVDNFFQFHNDITYKAKIKGKQSFIYLLIELQLNPEELMAFRMLFYPMLLLSTYQKQNKQAKKLPLVLPICLYNGKVQYPFSTSMYDCFEDPATARQFKLLEQFMLLDLNNFDREELLKHSVSALFQTLYKESHVRPLMGN